jgi:DNA polymerase/3'-5' exonuclease PolX
MSKGDKRPHDEVLRVAEHIVTALTPFCERIESAGSLRRQRPWVGDIELVAIPRRPIKPQLSLLEPPEYDLEAETELGAFLKENKVKFRVNGQKQKSFYYGSLQVDLYLPLVENWGWRYMLSTGSQKFNVWLVMSAAAGGAMPTDMNSDGGWIWRQGVKVETPEEADVFREMKLPFIPVGSRDDGQWLEILNGQTGK